MHVSNVPAGFAPKLQENSTASAVDRIVVV